MEESKSSGSSSSSQSISSISIPDSSCLPSSYNTTTVFRKTRTMNPAGNPTFIRFIRANTHVHTNVIGLDETHSLDIPDLSILQGKIEQVKEKSSFEDNKKELLKDFVKVREATPYEVIEEKQRLNNNQYLKSLYIIKSALSETCLLLTKNTIFESLIIILIFINTMTIAFDSIYYIPSYLDNVFLVIYTIESALKIGAVGVYKHPNSYLRSKWNILDLSIVVTGWIESFQYKLNILRFLRILRPLRNISSIKGLRVIFMALVQAAKPLVGTLGTLIFFIFLFAIAGIETMMGSFRFRCMNLSTGLYGDDKTLCGNDGCAEGWVCVQSIFNPNYGNTSFDSIFYALIIVFECVTLQTWVPIMNLAQKSISQATVLYFIPLTFVGAFLILNLSLAVIKSSFSKSMIKLNTHKNLPELEEEMLDSSIDSEEEEIKEEIPPLENRESTKIMADGFDFKKEFNNDLFQNKEPLNNLRRLRRSSSSGFQIDFEKLFSQDFEGANKKNKKSQEENIEKELLKPKVKYEIQEEIHEEISKEPIRRKRRSSTLALALLKLSKKDENITKINDNYIESPQVNLSNELDIFRQRSNRVKRSLKKKISTIITNGIGKSLNSLSNSMDSFHQNSKNYNSVKLLGKLKHSITIRKDLIDKIKKTKKIGKVKLMITEKFNFASTSNDEIIPQVYGLGSMHFKNNVKYEFMYKKIENGFENELEKKWRIETEYFLSKHSEYENKMSIFRNLSLKCGYETAFIQIMGLTAERIKCVEFEDEIKGKIEGNWSGCEIFQDDERNAYFSQSLSTINSVLWSQGISGKIQQMQYIAKRIENSKFTIITMIVIVTLNALILSLEYYGMSPTMENSINTMNLVFNLIFISELTIRVAALGLKEFCRDSMNYIDTVVIVLSFLELSANIGNSALSAFRVIRIIRILRIYRFARLLPFMKSLVCVITYSLPKFIYLAVLLALLNLVYALLGYQIFANKLNNGPDIRTNFDNFGWAYLSVFQVLTLSYYSDILYDVMKSSAGPWSSLYIFIWIIIGNFVALNLFIAILLDSFVQESNEDEEDDMSIMEKTLSLNKKNLFTTNRSKTLRKREAEKIKILQAINTDEKFENENQKELDAPLFYNIGCSKSYLIFSKENIFRIICYRLTSSKYFNFVTFGIIFCNCMVLVWETYTYNDPSSSTNMILIKNFEMTFTLLYLSEFVIKSIAIGILNGENAYFTDSWNILDFIILVISCFDTFTTFMNLSSLKVFRVIRALRPLRFISRNSSMKQLVSALISSIGAIAHVILILFVVWFMFAILGVSIFSGKLYSCENSNYDNQQECLLAGYKWINSDANFDNVLEAFLSLFIIGMLEGWQEIMYKCIDARGRGYSPLKDYNIAAAYYFIFFIYVGSFFFLHLFMGVVFLKFYQAKKEESSIHLMLLNKKQQFWIELQRLVVKSSPNIIMNRPSGAFRSKIYSLVTHEKFEIMIFAIILLNMLVMSMSYENAPFNYNYSLDWMNIACVIIFTVEIGLKIWAFEFKNFCKSNWNIFDLLVIICGYIDIILDSTVSAATKILRTGPQIFRVFRIFRVSRLIRVFRPLKSLQNLLTILKHSISAIFNVVSLLILFTFIYAIIGVFLFNAVPNGTLIDDFNNFRNFIAACVILIRISTGGDWPSIMFECSLGTGRSIAALYFCTYISITILVILNLFIMVIIQNYEDFESNPNSSLHIFTKMLRRFDKSWEMFSHFSHGIKIHHKDLTKFMINLGPELGFNREISFDESIKTMSKMAFVVDKDGNIAYHDMLYAVLNRIYGVDPNEENDQVASILLRKEERETFKRLQQLKRKTEWKIFKKHSTNKIIDRKSFEKNQGKNRNLFFDVLFARKLLRGWKNVVERKKKGEVIFSECESEGREMVSLENYTIISNF